MPSDSQHPLLRVLGGSRGWSDRGLYISDTHS